MKRLRALIACLLMLAVPFQGFAAASMAFCGMATQLDHGASHQHASDHAADHAPGHDHAAGKSSVKAPGAVPNAAHKCSTCADCCSSVAIASQAQVGVAAPAPMAEAVAPVVVIHTRTSPVPDKPPRA